ncbi:Calnexin [Chondrus crispus]|uniref:Calnexin n=1 Tax=Chondrus crispus TaxID=2769 RepID=R7QQ73_CHOCR|nr:Calnexin [Chondrus crispus]CDF40274.1 Calnexin [Chondrus crispus]|eukprot:XP_005710568.1 Calnexin [Chondrus crispus]
MPPDDEDEDEDEDEGDGDGDEEDPEGEPADPDAPAVLDPEGEENASYASPYTSGALFFDDFQSGLSKWIHTSHPEYITEFKVGQGAKPTFKGDRALIIPVRARKYALSSKIAGLDRLDQTDLVLQYEVKLDEGMTCGGAYMKLPTAADFDPAKFDGSTPYSIMFGPDRCGPTDKVHFIFQSKNPVTGKNSEHHLIEPPTVANVYDKKTHLYTIIVKKDGNFQMFIDDELKKDGTLSTSFAPPVQPPKEIDDPEDKKPADWVDDAKIPDPEATKPEDWDEEAPKEIVDEDAEKPQGWLDDEPATIPDPEAKQPEEWDTEEDGEWEVPTIPNAKCDEVGCGEWKPPMKANPAYKGKWSAPKIDNPKYIGVWKPRKIPNPEYYEIENPTLLPVHGLGFEIWTMDQGVLFDNVWLGSDISAAEKFRKATFVEKQKTELEREEEANKKAEAEEKVSRGGRDGKVGAILDKMEDAVDMLEDKLRPVEEFIISKGGESYLNKLINMGVQKPMIMVVGFPIALVLVFLILLSGSKKKAPTPEEAAAAAAAEKKKTDAASPDDAAGNADTSSTTTAEPENKTIRKRRTATAD